MTARGCGKSKIVVGSIAAVVLLCWVTAFGGCALSRSGTLEQNCTSDSQCDDANPCTSTHCSVDGLCVVTVLTDVSLEQAKGDCKEQICENGQQVGIADDSDTPDPAACLVQSCSGGELSQTVLVGGEVCEDSNGHKGTCDKDGKCIVKCTSKDDEVCDDGKPCTQDSCDPSKGECINAKLSNQLAPDANQVEGDCAIALCVDGEKQDLIDNGDVPDDDNPCTEDLCTEGVASNTDLASGTTCQDDNDALAKVCDGVGKCVQCNGVADCSHLPNDDDCQTRTCVANTCGQTFTAADTPVNAGLQTTGDCKIVVCDGSGGTKNNNDNPDLPVDGNPCTDDLCNSGTPTNPNKPQGTSCGSISVCDNSGNCVGCNVPTDCNGTDTFCQVRTCVAKSCGVDNTADGTALPAGSQTSGDCLEVQCDGNGATKSVAKNNDPFNDNNQCTDDLCNNGSPQNPAKALDAACNENGGKYCDGASTCVECNNAGQCSGAGDCQVDACTAKSCAIDPEPASTPAPAGHQTPADCKTVMCDGMGAVNPTPANEDTDLPIDGKQCTQDVCTSGVASNPPEAAETMCNENGGQVCNGSAMSPMCVECATDNQCLATESCDTGTWTCKLKDGQGCSVPGDCISGFCEDLICCATACGGTCKACNVSGSLGTCSNVVDGTDPDGDCTNGSCKMGACALDDGQTCSMAPQCYSGNCIDLTCCATTCSDTCKACNLAGSLGTCDFIAHGDDPLPECTDGACDGMGVCKLDDGQTCMMDAECLSGHCIDGYCCDTDCTGTCKACDVGGNLGICTDIPAGTDP